MKTNWPALRCGCLILASMTLAIGPSLAQTKEPAKTSPVPAVISSVAITEAPQRASVRVEGEGHLDVHASRMQNPERLVLDFSGARLAVRKTSIPGVSIPVRGVRLGQYRPDIARVVIDLTSAAPYQISREATAVVIWFEAQPSVPVDQPSKAAVTTEEGAKPYSTFQFSSSIPRTVKVRTSTLTRISAPRFALPGELTRPSIALASFGAQSDPARPQPTPAAGQEPTPQPAQQPAQEAPQQANPAPAPVAAPPRPQATSGTMKYTGEPISVNLKDVDLKDFFRLIHEISGLNVVLDPAVKGSLTIVLDEVPWDQALDIVLQNNGLDKQLNGNVLRIATRDTLKREAETQRDLIKAQADAVDPVTVTRQLSYAKASTMKDTLKKFLSSRGDILSDDRSNQLIIRDIPSVIPVVDNLIHQLDRKTQQVEIEARVVSASRSFAQDIGTELGFNGSVSSGKSVFQGIPTVGASGVVPIAPTNPPVPEFCSGCITSGNGVTNGLPLVTNFAAGVPTTGIGFSHRSPNFALDFFITAAEAKGVGKLLSKPKVVTQNNEKATVKQGVKIPIQTTINNTISVQYIDAVLKLEVTPQITAEGTIFMDVLVENTQIDAGIPRVQGIPALDTQSAETKVLVQDGGTVVIGGVIITNNRLDVQEVPFVGSLPLIGRLFKRTNVNISSQELLFFLTPRIIPG